MLRYSWGHAWIYFSRIFTWVKAWSAENVCTAHGLISMIIGRIVFCVCDAIFSGLPWLWFFVRIHKAFRFIRDTINPTIAIAAKNMIYPKLLVNRIANCIVSFSWLPSVSCTGARQSCMMKRTHKETRIRKRGFRQQGLPYVDGIISSTHGRESVPRLA